MFSLRLRIEWWNQTTRSPSGASTSACFKTQLCTFRRNLIASSCHIAGELQLRTSAAVEECFEGSYRTTGEGASESADHGFGNIRIVRENDAHQKLRTVSSLLAATARWSRYGAGDLDEMSSIEGSPKSSGSDHANANAHAHGEVSQVHRVQTAYPRDVRDEKRPPLTPGTIHSRFSPRTDASFRTINTPMPSSTLQQQQRALEASSSGPTQPWRDRQQQRQPPARPVHGPGGLQKVTINTASIPRGLTGLSHILRSESPFDLFCTCPNQLYGLVRQLQTTFTPYPPNSLVCRLQVSGFDCLRKQLSHVSLIPMAGAAQKRPVCS